MNDTTVCHRDGRPLAEERKVVESRVPVAATRVLSYTYEAVELVCPECGLRLRSKQTVRNRDLALYRLMSEYWKHRLNALGVRDVEYDRLAGLFRKLRRHKVPVRDLAEWLSESEDRIDREWKGGGDNG